MDAAFTTSVARITLDRVVFEVAGEEPLRFLHDTGTQDVLGLHPGRGALTCFLDEKGRVQSEARLLVLPDGTVTVDADSAAADHVGGWLRRIAPLSGCEVTRLDRTVVAVRGPDASTAIGLQGDAAHIGEHGIVRTDHGWAVRVAWGAPGWDIIDPRADPAVPAGSTEDFERARITGGRPRYGVDVTADSLINETPLLVAAVSMTKGCYPGQESVARVHNLGRIRRRLVGLRFDAAPPPAGTTIVDGERDIGVITSAAQIPDGGVGLGYLRTEVAAGSRVSSGGVPAGVSELMPGPPAPADIS